MKNGYIETYKQYFRILKYNDDFIITDEHGTTLGQAKTLEGARCRIDTISAPRKSKILDILNSKYVEYIENVEKVENILNQCEFDLIALPETKKQYNYILLIDDKKFDYHEGKGNEKLNAKNKNDKIINAIWCLLSDRDCVSCYDEYDFICEFGYNENADKLKEGHFIYNTILENNEKLKKCFSKEQLEFLTNNIQL